MLVELVQCKLVNLLEDLCDASGRSKSELVGVMLVCCGAFVVGRRAW
jgi:hypothetical protein